MMEQLNLFGHVVAAFADAPAEGIATAQLYDAVATAAGIDLAQAQAKVPIGAAGTLHTPFKRAVRWHQQTLKAIGVVERIPDRAGFWRLTQPVTNELDRAADGVRLVAFSTTLGVAVWARHEEIFRGLGEPIALCVTSPPYPLRQARAYGNPTEAQYVDPVRGPRADRCRACAGRQHCPQCVERHRRAAQPSPLALYRAPHAGLA
ncbi:hypothetical protein [Cupriavidus consociatus]|uniref:hypothetical protein n=1 Tax=Cupriavidus consociatus TaxID=2821357 RepID=UPI0024E00CE0|nr:hypothetical protein [Cupriavidus sp. LEh21]MDK2661478.1 hypothetical protein [Cupriavidus sp. LEh21]